MDYDYFIRKVEKNTKLYIINKYKMFNVEEKSFIDSNHLVRICLSQRNNKNIICNNFSLFEKCYQYYNNPDNYYKKGVPISRLINNEISNEFYKIIAEKKPVNQNYKEIENYNFKSFILDLIKYDYLRRIEYRLSENSHLYELYFENEDYTDFTLEKFDGHVINSELYKKLFSKFYPNKSLPIAVKKVTEWGNVVYDIFIDNIKVNNPLDHDNSIVKSLDIKLEKTNEKKIDSNWSVEEKSFLFYILCNVLGKNGQIDHQFPVQIDHRFRCKLTT